MINVNVKYEAAENTNSVQIFECTSKIVHRKATAKPTPTISALNFSCSRLFHVVKVQFVLYYLLMLKD